MNLKHLADDTLHENTKRLVEEERELLIAILHHLKEIDTRKLFSSLKFGSLFSYALSLGYSEDQAQRRIEAMRVIRDLPEIEEKVVSGELTLTHLNLAQTYFRSERKKNQALSEQKKLEFIDQITETSTREAQKFVAHLLGDEGKIKEGIKVITSELSEARLAVKEPMLKKIEIFKGLIAHSLPEASLSEIIDKALDLAIASVEKTRGRSSKAELAKEPRSEVVLKTAAPRKSTQNPGARPQPDSVSVQAQPTRHIPIAIKRALYIRDEGRCQNCSSGFAIEGDHIHTFAKGGETTLTNLQLLCRNCNQRKAILEFGVSKMQSFIV